MITLDTNNGHNAKIIDNFNEESIHFSDSDLLLLILNHWADDQDLEDITNFLNYTRNEEL
jgi:DNA polymerase sigma